MGKAKGRKRLSKAQLRKLNIEKLKLATKNSHMKRIAAQAKRAALALSLKQNKEITKTKYAKLQPLLEDLKQQLHVKYKEIEVDQSNLQSQLHLAQLAAWNKLNEVQAVKQRLESIQCLLANITNMQQSITDDYMKVMNIKIEAGMQEENMESTGSSNLNEIVTHLVSPDEDVKVSTKFPQSQEDIEYIIG